MPTNKRREFLKEIFEDTLDLTRALLLHSTITAPKRIQRMTKHKEPQPQVLGFEMP